MSKEILSVFNDNFRYIGEMDYETVHRHGYWHQVVHCWIYDTFTGSILFQRRSEKMLVYANMLDVAVAGHCRQDEEPAKTVVRESAEELGITINPKKLYKFGIRRDSNSDGDVINREFQHIYLYLLDSRKITIKPQKDEVQYVVLVRPNDVAMAILDNATIEGLKLSKRLNIKMKLSSSDFIASVDNYNVKLPLAIQRYLSGENQIFI